MNPNDLGDFSLIATVAENLTKLDITDFVKQANNRLREILIGSNLEVSGTAVKLVTSRTGFGGERMWFSCPICIERKGVLYQIDGLVGCRKCLGVKYRGQRFKGMLERGL